MRIATWNSQGGGDDKMKEIDKILSEEYDVICIQEAGNGPGFYQFNMSDINERCIISSEYNGYQCIQWENDLGANARCSIVMYVRWQRAWFDIVVFNCKRNLRPLIGIKYDNKFISTTHCPAFNPLFARRVRNDFALKIIKSFPKLDWQIVGDFNYDSRCSDQKLPSGAEIKSQNSATQKKGGILDYMVKKVGGVNFEVEVGCYKGSDHKQVFFKQV